ncbi:MAG: RICIN domain-containing protein [Acidobacteriota bacterium]
MPSTRSRLVPRILRLTAFCLLVVAGTGSASATDCWRVTGWTGASGGFERALLAPTSCTTVPDGTGWTQPIDSFDDWLRIDLSDPRVTGWDFAPLLIQRGTDGFGVPIVETTLIVCTGCPNITTLLPYPPEQGVPAAGARVKLRHAWTNNCILTSSTNGQRARNSSCRFDDKIFVLDDAGSGTFRLRNEEDNQCLYTTNTNGQPLFQWGCWNDPNMRFRLTAASGGYRLRNETFGQCAYGSSSNFGLVHTWGCWNDPNMVYRVDIVNY